MPRRIAARGSGPRFLGRIREDAGDVEELSECFAPYATVRADDEFYEGRAAMKAWKATNLNRNRAPLKLQVSNSDATLKAR